MNQSPREIYGINTYCMQGFHVYVKMGNVDAMLYNGGRFNRRRVMYCFEGQREREEGRGGEYRCTDAKTQIQSKRIKYTTTQEGE